MKPTPVAFVFLRHDGEILLLSDNGSSVSESGEWRVPVGRAGETPPEMAASAIETETPLHPQHVERVRKGELFQAESLEIPEDKSPHRSDHSSGETNVDAPIRIHPFLYDCSVRPPETISESYRWVSPTVLLHEEFPRYLWKAYDRIRPTVGTIESDTEHGSTTLSIRALNVLRDEAGLVASDESEFSSVEAVARKLVTARPAMAAVSNRVGRVVATADDQTPTTVSETAHAEIARASTADDQAASSASERIEDERVATLSRSGTVLKALEMGTPSAVLVAESRPGGEGVGVANYLGEFVKTTLTTDSAFPGYLGEWDADILLVGADSILADGEVVNKVGTFGAAVAATHHEIQVVVVAASDKISPETSFDPEPRDEWEITEEKAEAAIHNPTFERVPPSCVDAFVTEQGVLGTEEIRERAEKHAEWRSILTDHPEECS